LYVEAGPQFGFVLNREIEIDDNPIDSNIIQNDDDENFEIGLGLGLGYSFTEKIDLSLRYNYGIIQRQNLNTSVVQLSLNYKI